MSVLATDIPCGPNLTCPKAFGYLTIIMAFIVFVGSVYLILSAVFGRRMGYLVLAVAFFGWMTLFSGIWTFGAHLGLPGVTTPKYQGPRGVEPAWVPVASGLRVTSGKYPVIERYPVGPWKKLGPGAASAVQSVQSAVQEYLVEQGNEQLGLEPTANNALLTTDFTVEDVEFTSVGNTPLAAARAFYNNGGPSVIVLVRHDSGDVPIYSYAFFFASILGFLIHLPFLDRAERKRKAVLTGGARPPWYGPA